MTTTREIYNLICENEKCSLEKITMDSEENLLSNCPICKTKLGVETDELSCEEEEEYDQHYIDCWNRDMDDYHRNAYGLPTPEEGGIRDYSYDSVRYNDAGEPIGYC